MEILNGDLLGESAFVLVAALIQSLISILFNSVELLIGLSLVEEGRVLDRSFSSLHLVFVLDSDGVGVLVLH